MEIQGKARTVPNPAARVSPRNPAKLLDALESENIKLRDTVAELALETEILREQLGGKLR